ncbi:HAD family hydrolase [Bacteroides gallinaceum]|uniref:HAD family hydrolase n=1 Tax=Bacteroides gallinaceum TaxID=1462571 RepID=UPI0025AB4F82|nr:HAD family phosphatase [Bacteroides gallinaceum]MDN0064986.1 HAD family phosphatase [Bacteroides gallinaceum]
MIKNVVFDFGGVIVDLDREQAVKAFVHLGLTDAGHILDKYHQTGIFQELEEGKLREEDYREKLGQLCGRTLKREEVRQAWMSFVSGMNLRKLDYITELRKQGYRTFLLSNTNPYLMDYWARTPQFTPSGKSIDTYFDKLYLSFEMRCMKPGMDIFKKMLEDARMQPEETLFIDDSITNIESGKKAGMNTLCVSNLSDWRKQVDNLLAKVNQSGLIQKS